MRPVSNFVDRQYFLNSIPFYGKGSNYITNQSGFNGGISVKFAALKDMSFPEEHKSTDFDRLANHYQGLRIGSRVQGQLINTGFNPKNKPQIIIGKLASVKIDRKRKEIRTYVRDFKTNEIYEIYAHTLNQLHESYVKTFSSFIVRD